MIFMWISIVEILVSIGIELITIYVKLVPIELITIYVKLVPINSCVIAVDNGLVINVSLIGGT